MVTSGNNKVMCSLTQVMCVVRRIGVKIAQLMIETKNFAHSENMKDTKFLAIGPLHVFPLVSMAAIFQNGRPNI